jgi:predicted Zn-dependent protease
MGLQAYQEILRKSRISHDPALNDLVTRVGTRIAEATGREQWLPEALQYYQASPYRS